MNSKIPQTQKVIKIYYEPAKTLKSFDFLEKNNS